MDKEKESVIKGLVLVVGFGFIIFNLLTKWDTIDYLTPAVLLIGLLTGKFD